MKKFQANIFYNFSSPERNSDTMESSEKIRSEIKSALSETVLNLDRLNRHLESWNKNIDYMLLLLENLNFSKKEIIKNPEAIKILEEEIEKNNKILEKIEWNEKEKKFYEALLVETDFLYNILITNMEKNNYNKEEIQNKYQMKDNNFQKMLKVKQNESK